MIVRGLHLCSSVRYISERYCTRYWWLLYTVPVLLLAVLVSTINMLLAVLVGSINILLAVPVSTINMLLAVLVGSINILLAVLVSTVGATGCTGQYY